MIVKLQKHLETVDKSNQLKSLDNLTSQCASCTHYPHFHSSYYTPGMTLKAITEKEPKKILAVNCLVTDVLKRKRRLKTP